MLNVIERWTLHFIHLGFKGYDQAKCHDSNISTILKNFNIYTPHHHFGTEYFLFVLLFVTPKRYNECLLDPSIHNQHLTRCIDVRLPGHVLYNSHVFFNLYEIWYMFILCHRECLLDPLEPINFWLNLSMFVCLAMHCTVRMYYPMCVKLASIIQSGCNVIRVYFVVLRMFIRSRIDPETISISIYLC